MKYTAKHTVIACFIGYIVQAIVNNFVPLLFVTFQSSYGIPLSKITALITINFVIQLCVDLFSAFFVDKLGYRVSILLAHFCAAAGLILLTVLPSLLPDPYIGILLSVAVYAVGGGLIEVLISPILESCPSDNEEAAMSLLHSFYCWGHMGVVLLSTAFFAVFGVSRWRVMALVWALLPLANAVFFTRVPLYPVVAEGEKGLRFSELFRQKLFWVLMVMMTCAGASEQAVSQWVSTFAEEGLHLSKTLGDLAGPMAFAFFMGLSRLIYGKCGARLNLTRTMQASCVLCLACYACIVWSGSPLLALLGCAVCGFSVGVLWPGTFSRAAAAIPRGGTAMFALLALAGDLGCSGGPTLVGLVSDAAGGELRRGILVATVFPAVLLLCLPLSAKTDAK